MSKKDYLKQATKKIYAVRESEVVSAELESHIDDKTEAYETRSFPSELAAEKAVEEMGEADLIAESFGQIHNTSSTVWIDMITLILHLGVLAAGWYGVHTYVEQDAGLFPVLLGAIALSLSLLLADEALCLKRRELLPSVLSLVRLAGTAVFLYFAIGAVDKAVNSDVSLLVKRIVSPYLAAGGSQFRQMAVLTATAVLTLLLSVGIFIALVWEIRTRTMTVKSRDNRLRRTALRITRYLAVLFAALTVVTAVKLYTDYRHYRAEYQKAYQTALSLLDECETQEQVEHFLKSSPLPFTPSYDYAGEQTGYEYKSNYTSLTVRYAAVEQKEPTMADKVLDAVMQPDGEQFAYTVSLTADTALFEERYDALTLGWLRLDEAANLRLHSLDLTMATSEEQYAHYRQFIPTEFIGNWTVGAAWDKEVSFVFTLSENQFRYQETFALDYPLEERLWVDEKEKELIGILNTYPDADDEAVAELTGAALRYETVKLSDYLDDDWYYQLGYLPEEMTFSLFYLTDDIYFEYSHDEDSYWRSLSLMKDGKMLTFCVLEAYDTQGVHINGKYSEQDSRTNLDVFRKISCRGCYFDREGHCYDNMRYLPYYTRDGRTFWIYTDVTKTESTQEYDIKNFYLTDRKAAFYDARQCYIDADGYLMFDTENRFQQGEGQFYTSPGGKQYTRALYTSWDSEGNILPYDAEYQDEVKLS